MRTLTLPDNISTANPQNGFTTPRNGTGKIVANMFTSFFGNTTKKSKVIKESVKANNKTIGNIPALSEEDKITMQSE